jgi:hypothetical protein
MADANIKLPENGLTEKWIDNGDGTYSRGMTALAGLSIPKADYLSLSYTGSNLTGVVYKSGGSGGTTVATLALTYDGSGNLTSVTRT